MQPRLRIRLALACPIMRAGLGAILSAQSDFSFVVDEQGTAGLDDGTIVIADYAAGVRAASRSCLSPSAIKPKILILTGRSKVWEVREAIESGVRGYVLQGCGIDELLAGIRLLGSGIPYFCDSATRIMAEAEQQPVLTRREKEVLQGLACGSVDKAIARELDIKVGTVKSHVKHLLKKLEVNTRTQAVIIGLRLGLQAGHSRV